MRLHQLAGDNAEVLAEASAPNGRNLVAGLQERPPPWRLPAANETGMPPVLFGEQFDNSTAFAVAAGRQDERSVMPFHQLS
jgi:hypothetical protein